jgi:hypothetical protein
MSQCHFHSLIHIVVEGKSLRHSYFSFQIPDSAICEISWLAILVSDIILGIAYSLKVLARVFILLPTA